MSYCRWSSDDFKSDVYVYEHVDGFFAIHVAGNRVKRDGLPESPGRLPIGADADSPAWKEWITKNTAFHDALEQADRIPIDLPHAGENFEPETAGEAADVLQMLRDLGYHVPDGVIEALREEQDSEEES